MCKGDRGGHKLRRFVAGKAEHHSLIACAILAVIALLAELAFKSFVHAHSDVGALLVDRGQDRAGVAVKAVFRVVIADFVNGFAHNGRNVNIAVGGYLAHYHDHARSCDTFAGNACLGVVCKDGVEYCVGNLVTDLIGMSLSD